MFHVRNIAAKEVIYSLQEYVGTVLTNRSRHKMAAISQTTFWNEMFWIKMYEFRLKFTDVCC